MVRAVINLNRSNMAKSTDMEKTRLGESGDVLIKFEIRVKSYTKEFDMKVSDLDYLSAIG